jgi:hypothetical protein
VVPELLWSGILVLVKLERKSRTYHLLLEEKRRCRLFDPVKPVAFGLFQKYLRSLSQWRFKRNTIAEGQIFGLGEGKGLFFKDIGKGNIGGKSHMTGEVEESQMAVS